jgi:transposase-like protein
MNWHPFAERFPLIEGEEREALQTSIRKTNGVDEQPVLYRVVDGRKQGLDGRNRFLICRELGIKCRMKRVVVADEDVKDFILRRNVHRRHMTREVRQQIVTELRADGESTRQIAQVLGVDPKTVRRDLASGGAFAPPGSAKNGQTEPCSGTVRGRDGKIYSATTPASEPKIPERLHGYFASVPMFKHAARIAVRLANLFQDIEQTPAYLKAVEGKKHTAYSTYIRSAGRAIEAITPTRPCPECGGIYEPSPDNDPCKVCADRGYQTIEDLDE